MSNFNEALLDACLAGDRQGALRLARMGVGLRHYCSRRHVEPLVACAIAGWGDVFEIILNAAYFEPFDSALNLALQGSVSSGHADLALRCHRYGAYLNLMAVEKALSNGHWELLLARNGVLLNSHSWVGAPKLIDDVFDGCLRRKLDEAASSFLHLGVSVGSLRKRDAQWAELIAHGDMRATAAAWAARYDIPTSCAAHWAKAFPALILSRDESAALRLELGGSALQEPGQNRDRQRL